MNRDLEFMNAALSLARTAFHLSEVPIGALVTFRDQVIATGFNLREHCQDPIKHAEIIALEHAANYLGAWRLTDCALYVTLEPCIMCAGALHQARIGRVVFGASDPKAGALGSLYSVHNDARLNHQFPVIGGIGAAEASSLLKSFFSARR